MVKIPNANAHVTLSKLTIRNGVALLGGGIYSNALLTIKTSTLSGNSANYGGGIYNNGTLTINNNTVSGNFASGDGLHPGHAGGIANGGTLKINNSTISGNRVGTMGSGGGISNLFGISVTTISNSTLSGNSVFRGVGGGISNLGTLTISNSTLSGNSAVAGLGGGIYGGAIFQNSIVANSLLGGNCSGTMTSKGYNLSSDNTCNFNGTGDMNNTDLKLGQLGNYGGPTQTIPLFHGSPAIDAGNPNGCTDGQGHLLKTDQRGMPRPDKEDTGGCDMGAFEDQGDSTCTPPGGRCGPGLPPCCPVSIPHHSVCSSQHGFGICVLTSEKRGLGISLDH